MFRNITPVTKNLIIINIVLFVATFLLQRMNINLDLILAGFFPLSPNFHLWQIVTHMFMHGSIMHIAFNMLTLVSFGPVLEQVFGQKKYLTLYFAAGFGGFLFYNIWNFYEVSQLTNFLNDHGYNLHEVYKYADFSYVGERPINTDNVEVKDAVQSLFNMLTTPMVGASGAIFGVIAAFSVLFPNAEMMFMFIPFPIKAKFLTPIIIIVSIFLGIKQLDGDNVAHFAHIGGAIIGFLFALSWKKQFSKFQ